MIGTDPMALLIPAAPAGTCAIKLPVGTPPNAIVFGTGAVGIVRRGCVAAWFAISWGMLITVFAVLL